MAGFCAVIERENKETSRLHRARTFARQEAPPGNTCATALCASAPEIMLPSGSKVCKDCACAYYQGLLRVASKLRVFREDLYRFLHEHPYPES